MDARRAAGRIPDSGLRPARLSRSADFDRAYRRGRSVASRHLVLYVFPRSTHDAPRLGVSVGRRAGGAVARNRLKRMLRDAFRAQAGDLSPGHDYVAVARPDAGALAEREGTQGVSRALGELLRASAVRPAADPGQTEAAESTRGPGGAPGRGR